MSISPSRWTVILTPVASPTLEQTLRRSGLPVVRTPDLYDLPLDSPLAGELQMLTDPLVVVSNLYPRAAFWLLQHMGVAGQRSDAPQTRTSGRAIHCLDTTGRSEGELLQEILSSAGAKEHEDSATAVEFIPADESLPARWYPVIDYDRCTSCLQCVEFCLFGVYALDEADVPRVTQGEKCKPGCPACSRVCPAAAIMFPRFHARGPIAGDDAGRPEHFEGDAARRASKQDVEVYHRTAGAAAMKSPASAAPPAGGAMDARELDSLINELENFDS